MQNPYKHHLHPSIYLYSLMQLHTQYKQFIHTHTHTHTTHTHTVARVDVAVGRVPDSAVELVAGTLREKSTTGRGRSEGAERERGRGRKTGEEKDGERGVKCE
jgi:hypothetical protein